MVAEFEDAGIRFKYPENWQLEREENEAGWTVTDGQARPEGRTGALTGRGCGTASVATQPLNGRTRVIVSVIVYPCSTPSK